MAQLAHNHPNDPVDVIIGDWMSEYNMTTRAANKSSSTRQEQAEEKPNTNQHSSKPWSPPSKTSPNTASKSPSTPVLRTRNCCTTLLQNW
jgi:hypothetical protein